MEKYNISTEVWKMYDALSDIAERLGRADEARKWRRKAEEAIAAFERQSGGQWRRR